jgi:hypothetical protein
LSLTPQGSAAACLVFTVALAGCSTNSRPRPRAGDVITPRIMFAGTWSAGCEAALSVRLHAQGTEDPIGVLLNMEEVPETVSGIATLQFLNRGRLLPGQRKLELTRDC